MSPEAIYAYKIAEAGSPNLGPGQGIPGLYNVENLGSAVDLMNRLSALEGEVLRSETQPIVMVPGPGDAYTGNDVDSDLRQLRISAFGFTPAQDQRNYSDISSVQMGCFGQISSPRGLKVLGLVDIDEKLNEQSDRSAFTVHPNTGEVQGVVDPAPLFAEDGTNSGNEYRDYIGTPSSAKVQSVGLQMQGYFGARG